MRLIQCPFGNQRAAAPVDQRMDAGGIVGLARNQYLQIVIQADQAAIEHPVNRPR